MDEPRARPQGRARLGLELFSEEARRPATPASGSVWAAARRC